MKKENIIRYSILLLFLILFSIFSLRHLLFGGKVAPSVDALCPFGGFETLYTLIATGNFVPRILISSLILAVGILLTVLITKRSFCGYICPFGTVQELLGKISKKKIVIPEKIDFYLRFLKYIVLILIIVGTAITGTLVFRNYDPFASFFHFGKGIIWDYTESEFNLTIVAFSITIVLLLISIFIDRFFCKYLCPLGATMNIFTKFGASKINRNSSLCIDCKLCDKVCPMKVKVSDVKSVKDLECINCNQCVSACPKSALSITVFKKRISVVNYIVLSLILFIGVILISMLFGIWSSLPGNSIEDASGKIDPSLIKGWMTLADVSNSTKIPLFILISELNLPSDINASLPLKDIAVTYGIPFDTEVLREYISAYYANSSKNISDNVASSNLSQVISSHSPCPFGITSDPYPGKCGLYEDVDNSGICDYSG